MPRDQWRERRSDRDIEMHLVTARLTDPFNLGIAVDRAAVIAGQLIAQTGRRRPFDARIAGGRVDRRRGDRFDDRQQGLQRLDIFRCRGRRFWRIDKRLQ